MKQCIEKCKYSYSVWLNNIPFLGWLFLILFIVDFITGAIKVLIVGHQYCGYQATKEGEARKAKKGEGKLGYIAKCRDKYQATKNGEARKAEKEKKSLDKLPNVETSIE